MSTVKKISGGPAVETAANPDEFFKGAGTVNRHGVPFSNYAEDAPSDADRDAACGFREPGEDSPDAEAKHEEVTREAVGLTSVLAVVDDASLEKGNVFRARRACENLAAIAYAVRAQWARASMREMGAAVGLSHEAFRLRVTKMVAALKLAHSPTVTQKHLAGIRRAAVAKIAAAAARRRANKKSHEGEK